MTYYLDLFTPETWAAFRAHGGTVSGFRERQKRSADRIQPGDRFLCYLVRLSRWCGVLEVISGPAIDNTPIFSDPDPFTVRFAVRPVVLLDVDRSIPIDQDEVWGTLSFTKNIRKKAVGWAQFANLRSSLRPLPNNDGTFLESSLLRQLHEQSHYPLSAQDRSRLNNRQSIRGLEREVIVEVPDEDMSEPEESAPDTAPAARESHHVQAGLARIGAEMGFRVWIPRADRAKVQELIPNQYHPMLLDALPLNYDDTTLRTIEQIDVIWMRNRSMARAFEVEHTTAIYSGLLRMADLLALQPNMDIKLHIVAPDEKREKVLREIKRPVFSLLDKGPLYESCSYLSYASVNEILSLRHLAHTSDTIVEEYEESAQDT